MSLAVLEETPMAMTREKIQPSKRHWQCSAIELKTQRGIRQFLHVDAVSPCYDLDFLHASWQIVGYILCT